MTRATRSPLRASSETGRDYGIRITDDDIRRLKLMARWYTMTPRQLARAELVYGRDWTDAYPNGTPEAAERFESMTIGIRRRLSRLSQINTSGTSAGPLTNGTLYDGKQATWFATPYGVTAANIVWNVRGSVNPMYLNHALMAGDIGQHLELSLKGSYQILSERELSTGYDAAGYELRADFNSYYQPTNGEPIAKKPDIAILAQDRRSFIAVEVERRESRSITSYREKLNAYSRNPNVIAVWYMCASERIAQRVSTAERRELGGNAAAGTGQSRVSINVIPGHDDWFGIPNLRENRTLGLGLQALHRASVNGPRQ